MSERSGVQVLRCSGCGKPAPSKLSAEACCGKKAAIGYRCRCRLVFWLRQEALDHCKKKK